MSSAGAVERRVSRCHSQLCDLLLGTKEEFYSQSTISSLSRSYQPVAISRERKVLLSQGLELPYSFLDLLYGRGHSWPSGLGRPALIVCAQG